MFYVGCVNGGSVDVGFNADALYAPFLEDDQ
jgi:hypothetical protein